jgi:hypothetical protein
MVEEDMLRNSAVRTMIALGLLAFFPLAPVLASKASPAAPEAKSPAIVIGFLGGFVGRNSPVHAEVQLAVRLRKSYPAGVDVETFESRHVPEAHRQILDILGGKKNGTPTAEEKHDARIVIYGHSWGAASGIELARTLQKDGIPVLLTIQVDSIGKVGRNDTQIPANVERAVNFYQSHGLLRGAHDIYAADPAQTKIIGNYQYDYSKSQLSCDGYPWWDRYIVKAHTQIECDPVVWNKVDALIRQTLPPSQQGVEK